MSYEYFPCKKLYRFTCKNCGKKCGRRTYPAQGKRLCFCSKECGNAYRRKNGSKQTVQELFAAL